MNWQPYRSLAVLAILPSLATAQVLTGAGSHLPIPSPNPGDPPNQARLASVSPGGFTGTWTAPALAPWIGTFNAIGPIPGTTSSGPGSTLYDFTTLSTGVLPIGTYFRFGDLDQGSTTAETYVLQAFGSSGAITTPWLTLPIGVSGSGVSATSMPGWNFNALTGTYTFDGTTVPGNPNVAFFLQSTVPLTGLELQRSTAFTTFSLHAPVPSPGTLAAAATAGLLLVRRRRG